MSKKPNIVFVFGDQWRQQAIGYAGDPNVKTPHLDTLAGESVNFTHALAGCPVCSPYRASLLTGQRPLTHGVFVNDVYLQPRATSIAETFSAEGYDTAYIGKWHVGGHGRSNYIPPERRLGFDYWKVLECTHDYNHSPYYAGDSDEKRYWDGYDAITQTRDAETYIRTHGEEKPFLLMLSWGPPHDPYGTAPEEYRNLYNTDTIKLRPNVPEEIASQAREWLAEYYAHCSALDACVGDLLATLENCGLYNDTIFVFTSDHGDMLGSQGHTKKQRPWDESIRVPFLLRYPGLAGWRAKETDALIDAPDIMPTLLGLCGIPIPATVEGFDFSRHVAVLTTHSMKRRSSCVRIHLVSGKPLLLMRARSTGGSAQSATRMFVIAKALGYFMITMSIHIRCRTWLMISRPQRSETNWTKLSRTSSTAKWMNSCRGQITSRNGGTVLMRTELSHSRTNREESANKALQRTPTSGAAEL